MASTLFLSELRSVLRRCMNAVDTSVDKPASSWISKVPGGSGSVAGDVRVAGVFSPGHSPGYVEIEGDYVQELIDATDYPNFDIEATNKTFMEWEHHKHEDIMGFRNHSYRSLMTGTMAPVHHTPWLKAMDDSLEAYLRN